MYKKGLAYKLLSFFSLLNLSLQPFFNFLLISTPAFVLAQEQIEAGITFDKGKNSFNLTVNKQGEIHYELFYRTDSQIENVSGASKNDGGNFSQEIYAGTCSSGGVCTPHQVLRGILKIEVESEGWLSSKRFTINNGNLNLVEESAASGLNLTDEENSWLENPDQQQIEKECLTNQSFVDTKDEDWQVDKEKETAETKEKVKLGVKYVFPLEDKVSVSFKCLPKEGATPLKIQKVKISDLNLPEGVNPYGEWAYDITTGMQDGTFEYEMTLPKTKEAEAKVIYIEKSLEEIEEGLEAKEIKEVGKDKVEQKKDEEKVEVRGLDHFTLFIVTNPGPKLSTAMVNGMPYVSVPPSTNVTVKLQVTTSGSGDDNDWKSTKYRIGSGDWICVNTGDHSLGSSTYTEEFGITAPSTVGSYNLSLLAYSKNSCTDLVSNEVTLTDAIRVVTSSPSLTPPILTDNPSDPISLTSVSGIWTDIIGGSDHQGEGSSEIRWGEPAGSQKSGLRFTNSSNQSFKTGDTFYLGMLTHMNWPTIHGTAATGAKLQITLDFNRPDIDNAVFSYDFSIEETSNSEGDCPIYQRTLTACDDKVTFPNSYGTTEFTIEDIKYTLVIDGFVDAHPTGTAVDAFITEEEKDNSAFLVGHLSSVLVEKPQITLTKKVNDQDVSVAPGPNLYIGDSVTWQYIIQNTGNVDLTNIAVTDNPVETITCPATTLASGSTMTCTASGTAQPGQFTNVATVTGTPPTGSNVSASDSSWYFGTPRFGHLIVQKTTIPAGDATSFTVEATGSGTITGGGTGTVTDSTNKDYEVTPGTYSVTETVPTGWSLTSNDCTNINVVAGETKYCTITNTKNGSITIIKDAQPNDAQDFSFTVTGTGILNFSLDDDATADATLSNTKVFNNLIPGTFTVTEDEVSGWGLDSILCSTGGVVDLENKKATITLTPGLDVTCTFTNTRDTGTIELKKVWLGIGGQTNLNIGTSAEGSEVATIQTGASGGTPLTTGQKTVVTGPYYLSESGGLDNYTKSLSCFNDTDNDGSKDGNESTVNVDQNNDSVSVAKGNHIICSYTNTYVPYCGDGHKDTDEECDDGNQVNGDGCSTNCTVETPPCVEGTGWATGVFSVQQGTLKNDSPILDLVRTNPYKTLGANDEAFFSLGYGGSIILSFVQWITDTDGNDLSFHETTWGRNTYPEEKAEVFVSQDGLNWKSLGEVTNKDALGVSYKDISGTGWNWIKYVKLVNTTTDTNHIATADGYDLDAIDVIAGVCEEPVIECGDSVVNQESEECDGKAGVIEGKNFCTSTCKLVPIYDGGHTCSPGTTPVKVGEYTIDPTDFDGETFGVNSDTEYLFKVLGTYNYDKNNSGKYADGAYGTNNNWETTRSDIGIWGVNKGVISLLGDLGSGVGVIEWDDDKVFNDSHIYQKVYTPNADNVKFLISDWYDGWYGNSCDNQGCMGDNSGGLKLEVYECQIGSDVEVCKVDDKGRPLSGWEVALASVKVDGPKPINVSNGDGTNSSDLPAGKYLVKVSGTYKYGNSSMNADAGFSYRPINIPSGCDCWLSGFDLTSKGLMAWVNGSTVNWGAYRDDHTYFYIIDHTGGKINLSVYDDQYKDNVNNNNFQFEIYEIPKEYYGTTGDGGCVTLENIPYGDYILDEALKDGWVNLSGKGSSVSIDSSEKSFTLVNKLNAPVTIVATKIVCDNEADLPNWGNGGSNITVDTAQNFLSDHLNCHTESGWNFQWGDDGDVSPDDSYIGEVAGWNTFGPTDSDGVATVNINDYGSTSQIKVREVLKENYIPFTYLTNGNNSDNVSAEIYCDTDVLNYDNDDRFTPEYGKTYYCVGFNAPKYGSISGMKFEDMNGDGIKNEGDNGLESWTIFIDANGNSSLDSGEVSKNTDANGNFSFTDLVPGYYQVCEVEQSGWTRTQPSDSACQNVTVNAGQNTSVNFGNFKLTYIQGRKYNDLNANGAQDAGEPEINGWTMRLYNFSWNQVGADQATQFISGHGNGRYRFENLFKGTYYICEVLSGGWTQTDPSGAEDVIINQSPNKLTEGPRCRKAEITTSGTPVEGKIFGNTQYGSIEVYKFEDLNGDGKKDGGEPLLPDWEILLGGQTATTSAEGKATFANLVSGEYNLSENLKDGWQQTGIYCDVQAPGVLINQPGEAYGHHGACQGWNKCGDAATCALKACQAHGYSQLVSYGAEKPCTQFNNCSLFYNIDINLSYQANWGNWCDVMGVTDIYCSNDNNNQLRAQAWLNNSINPVVNPGEVTTCYIGNFKLGSISGVKIYDKDDDGTKDDGEGGIEGWKIYLSGGSLTEEISTTTDSDGNYKFTGLAAGDYIVREEKRDGWRASKPESGESGSISISSGTNAKFDFFNAPPVSILLTKNNNAAAPVKPGDPVEYTLTITVGERTLSEMTLIDILPNGFSYQTGTTSITTTLSGLTTTAHTEPTLKRANKKLVWTWPTGIAGGSIVVVKYTVKIDAANKPSSYTNFAYVWGSGSPTMVESQIVDSVVKIEPAYTPEGKVAGGEVLSAATQTTGQIEGQVLGATLPAAGANTWFLLAAIALIGTGLALRPKKKENRQKN